MKQEIIVVQNLKCSGCANTIAQVLGAFPEIQDVKIKVENGEVVITTTAEDAREQYEAALTQAGYPPEGEANPFHRVAKSYVSCAIGRMKTPAHEATIS